MRFTRYKKKETDEAPNVRRVFSAGDFVGFVIVGINRVCGRNVVQLARTA